MELGKDVRNIHFEDEGLKKAIIPVEKKVENALQTLIAETSSESSIKQIKSKFSLIKLESSIKPKTPSVSLVGK